MDDLENIFSPENIREEHLPKEIKTLDGRKIVVNRELTSLPDFMLEGRRRVVTFVFFPPAAGETTDGHLVYGADTIDIGHQGIAEFAREIGIVDHNTEPVGGGVFYPKSLDKVPSTVVYDRDSDIYGSVNIIDGNDSEIPKLDINLINSFGEFLASEYPDAYSGYKPLQ